MTVSLNDFDYPLPKELIAQRPVEPRDASRLLVVDRKSGEFADRKFSDLAEYFSAGDVLVLNDTKVFKARILGRKKGTGGKVDILLLRSERENVWQCLIRPSPRDGQEMLFGEEKAEAVFIGRDAQGVPLVEFPKGTDLENLISKSGTMPLPPYIKRDPDNEDVDRYQTVFARNEGAVAAPTAGLHFTPELLKKIKDKGVEILYVTLHVGYGTFKPVEDLENHQMHAERFELNEETARCLNQARSEKRRIWAVGTTALRVLETCVVNKKVVGGKGETNLFIKPPFEFEVVDVLVTNFHLPKTTLLLLVSAFMGEKLRKKAYEHAIASKYRFYSYGDAMLIL